MVTIMLRGLAGLAALSALISCAPEAPADSAASYETVACSALEFEEDAFDDRVECGWLTVPESRERADARPLRLAVVRARATGKAVSDPILYLHGGPGIATLDVVPRALRGKSWPPLRESRDLIFFDQRGTGRSTPTLCPDFNAAMDEPLMDSAPAAETLKAALNAAQACRTALAAQNVDPRDYNSTEIAGDAEALRVALGYRQWNVFATSFGTLPAAELVRHYPSTVRSLLFDSAFPPNSPNRAEQISAVAESFAAIQRRCDDIAGCRASYGDVRALAAATAARLNETPFPLESGAIAGAAFLEVLWLMQVDGFTVSYVPEFLLRISRGDHVVLRTVLTAFGGNDSFGAYSHDQAWLVNCHDAFLRPTVGGVARAIAANPDLTGDMIAGATDQLCDVLQPGVAPKDFSSPLRTGVPALVFFGEFDPATPRSDALAAMEGLSNGVLLEIPGASHAPFYTDECTRGLGAAFFAAPDQPLDQSCLGERTAFAFADEAAFDQFMAELSQ